MTAEQQAEQNRRIAQAEAEQRQAQMIVGTDALRRLWHEREAWFGVKDASTAQERPRIRR